MTTGAHLFRRIDKLKLDLGRDRPAGQDTGMERITDTLLDAAEELADGGDYERALKRCETALEHDPKNIYAQICKGEALENIGRFGEALECYEGVLKVDPNNELGVSGRIYCLLNQNRVAEANEFTNAKLDENRNDKFVLIEMASALERMGRHAKAVKCYDAVLDLDPKSFNIIVDKAHSLEQLGHFEEAIKHYEMALDNFPTDVEEKINETYLQYAQRDGSADARPNQAQNDAGDTHGIADMAEKMNLVKAIECREAILRIRSKL